MPIDSSVASFIRARRRKSPQPALYRISCSLALNGTPRLSEYNYEWKNANGLFSEIRTGKNGIIIINNTTHVDKVYQFLRNKNINGRYSFIGAIIRLEATWGQCNYRINPKWLSLSVNTFFSCNQFVAWIVRPEETLGDTQEIVNINQLITGAGIIMLRVTNIPFSILMTIIE